MIRSGDALPVPQDAPPIRLLVADIDGCLVSLHHAPYDLERLAEVAALNRRSRHDDTVPPLTLLSGRPHPYVDAMMQLLDVTLPAVFENGVGMALRDPYHARLRPESERGLDALAHMRHLLEGRAEVVLQPGKMASMTVFPFGEGRDAAWVEALVRELVEDHRLDLRIDPARECVNLLLPGIDKGVGLRWLIEAIGVAPKEVAGIGDSAGDLSWLTSCGLSCAPVNADPEVRARVDLQPDGEDVAALLSLYHGIVAHNRALAREDGS